MSLEISAETSFALDLTNATQYGPELAAAFNTAAFWTTLNGDWAVDEGVSLDYDGVGGETALKTGFWESGEEYAIKITVSVTSGQVRPPYDGSTAPSFSYIGSSGTYEYDYTTGSTAMIIYPEGGSGFNGSITALSIKKKL